MCKKATTGSLLEDTLNALGTGLCDSIAKQIADAIIKQLGNQCPTTPATVQTVSETTEDGEQLSLPQCCANAVRMGGRQFRRGMLDVENQPKHDDIKPV